MQHAQEMSGNWGHCTQCPHNNEHSLDAIGPDRLNFSRLPCIYAIRTVYQGHLIWLGDTDLYRMGVRNAGSGTKLLIFTVEYY